MAANGGYVTADDLAGYKVLDGRYITTNYRGFDIHSLAAPAGGGLVVKALNILENFDLASLGEAQWAAVMNQALAITINSTTGLISGTISFDAVLHPNLQQVFNVTVNVSDGTDTTPESFQWTVNDVNRAPVAVDDSDATVQDEPVIVDVQANDSDADGDALTTVSTTTPANGTTAINAGDTVTYTPNSGFVGSDSFDYTIEDGFGGSATATVTVAVANVNDPPVVDAVPNQADLENEGVSLQIVASDVDGPNPLSYSATGLPPDVTINSSTGLISGTVSFDAVVHPAIQDVYSVTVEVSDGIDTTPVSFDWTITDVNRAPVAVDDSDSTLHDTSVTIDVLANDSDADGDGDGVNDFQVEGPFDLSVLYRNVPTGPRDSTFEDTLVDYMAGLQGTVDFLGGMDWELGAQYSQAKVDSTSPGLGLASSIQSRIDSGAIDVFAVNTDTGNFADGLDSGFATNTRVPYGVGFSRMLRNCTFIGGPAWSCRAIRPSARRSFVSLSISSVVFTPLM